MNERLVKAALLRFPTSIVAAGVFIGLVSAGAFADDARVRLNKDYDEMTAAEKTAARTAGRDMWRNKSLATLRVCGDPGNMPLSSIAGEGFQNKMMEVAAEALGVIEERELQGGAARLGVGDLRRGGRGRVLTVR